MKVFHFIKWSSGSVNKMFIMLQEEAGSQQSDCTTFQNALCNSFAFSTYERKQGLLHSVTMPRGTPTFHFKTASQPCSVFSKKSSNVESSFILN